MKNIVSVMSALACLSLLAVSAQADSVPDYGTWANPQFQLMQAPGEYFATTYTAPQQEQVQITGFYQNTDQYKVYVDGSLVLTTPAISGPAINYGDTFGTYKTPADAAGSGLFSEGTFSVNANDTISIQDIGPLFLDTAATASNGVNEYDAQVAIQATPEPGTAGILMLGGLALFMFRRRFTPHQN